MKNPFDIRFPKMALLLLLAIFGFKAVAKSPEAKSPDAPPVTYQLFYDSLSPYGTWIDYPSYGHVWNPNVNDGFRPYATNGHWASTDQGWAWVSDYDWGWAPFHYGRWLYDDMYGWLWLPGYDWSPAWVTWGYVDDFYCWAPLMPGIAVNVRYNSWRPNAFYWNACRRGNLSNRELSGVLERPEQFANLQGRIQIYDNFNSTRVNKMFYSKGPDVAEAEKYANHKIEQNSIKEVRDMGRTGHADGKVSVYSPAIQNPGATAGRRPKNDAQPSEFRRIGANDMARPVDANMQRPTMERSQQNMNIQRLPVFRGGGFSGGGGRRRN